jgi:DNA repair protein RecO (recombination protein O)
VIPGKTLVSLSKQETITDPIQLTILKKMNRKRLKSLLGDKPLKSKELFFVK